jgi:hypothetical protein
MKEFLNYDGNKPVLLECLVDTTEQAFPMVRINYFVRSLDYNTNLDWLFVYPRSS